jgi:pimeloyl-ACP methyl ester carboxylesterase
VDVRWHHVDGRPVRSLVVGTPRPGLPELVVVPGLGALGYLLPTVRTCAGWTRVHLLDLPGFGHRLTARLPATVERTAAAAAAWLAGVPKAPVLLVGHSTGAQAALRAALARPDDVLGLVMAGATFPPEARRLPALLRQVAATAPHELPGEVPAVLPYYLRGARGLPALLRSALADRPEDAVPGLGVPLVVLRGRRDGVCPALWAQALAAAAPSGRVRVVPGAHNAPYSEPALTAAALREAAATAVAASGT